MRHARTTLPLMLILLVAGLLVLAACNDDSTPASDSATGAEQSSIGLFDWEHDPNTILVRLDSRPNEGSPALLLNSIPPCTIWGDGRVVWTTTNERGDEDVLEARLSDDTIRAFLENIINRGFYEWDDELLPPTTTDPIVESITLTLYDEVRTVRRYTVWPQQSYTHILNDCRQLSDTPVLVRPQAGWVSAYEVPRDTQSPSWMWPPNGPFTLQEIAENDQTRWVEGDLATTVWLSAREDRGDIQVVERSGRAFRVAITVPGYSRDSMPPPDVGGDAAADATPAE